MFCSGHLRMVFFPAHLWGNCQPRQFLHPLQNIRNTKKNRQKEKGKKRRNKWYMIHYRTSRCHSMGSFTALLPSVESMIRLYFWMQHTGIICIWLGNKFTKAALLFCNCSGQCYITAWRFVCVCVFVLFTLCQNISPEITQNFKQYKHYV